MQNDAVTSDFCIYQDQQIDKATRTLKRSLLEYKVTATLGEFSIIYWKAEVIFLMNQDFLSYVYAQLIYIVLCTKKHTTVFIAFSIMGINLK